MNANITHAASKYRKITERFCAEIGENVILRSMPPENDTYECLHAQNCKMKDNCSRCKNKKV